MYKIILILMLFVGLSISQIYEKQINDMNPASYVTRLGTLVNTIKKALEGDDVLMDTATLSYAVGASDTAKVSVTAIKTWFDGSYLSIPQTDVAFTATSHDIADAKWGLYKVSVASDSTYILTMSASTYDTAILAIAALPATPSNEIYVGYVLIYANGALFNATTTKLNAATINVFYTPLVTGVQSWE